MNILTSPTEALAHDAEQQRARILSLPAGRELNALVAEQVFGWQPAHDALWRLPDGALVSRLHLPPYSTDPGAAWLICERLREIGLGLVIATEDDGWEIEVITTEDLYQRGYRGNYTHARHFPLTVCRAALSATQKARR